MRCYNCNKKFDYEKYYGICPKCGCFNRQETAEEQHEAVHDRFGDSSDEDTVIEATEPSAPIQAKNGMEALLIRRTAIPIRPLKERRQRKRVRASLYSASCSLCSACSC